MNSFKDWLIKEDGYVYFKPTKKIMLAGKAIDVSLLDLQVQNIPKTLRPTGNVSLKTDLGWVNATLRKGTGLSFYDFESITNEPMYEPLDNWHNHSLIIGKNNNRFDQNVDTNIAV